MFQVPRGKCTLPLHMHRPSHCKLAPVSFSFTAAPTRRISPVNILLVTPVRIMTRVLSRARDREKKKKEHTYLSISTLAARILQFARSGTNIRTMQL